MMLFNANWGAVSHSSSSHSTASGTLELNGAAGVFDQFEQMTPHTHCYQQLEAKIHNLIFFFYG